MNQYDDYADSDLIVLCRQGNDAAFMALYKRYRLLVYSYLHKLLPGYTTHFDDFFQQTWIKAMRNLDKYDDQQRFYAWLCRITHNLVIDHLRKQQKIVFVGLNDNTNSDTYDEHKAMEDEEFQVALENAINMLTKEQKEVIELRRKGFTFNKIAEIQKVNINTIIGRMRKAVNKLKEALKEFN